MSSTNSCHFIGRLGQPPVKRMVGEKHLIKFSIATNRKYKDGNGEKKEETTWVNLEAWRGLAQGMGSLDLQKGALLAVHGEYQQTQKDGVYYHSFRMTSFEVLDWGPNAKKNEGNDWTKAPSSGEPDLGQGW